MIKARLKTEKGGLICELKLPEAVDEMRLNHFVDFVVASRKLQEPEPEKMENPVIVMAEALSGVAGIDLDKVLRAKIGDIYQDASGLDTTLRGCYGWVANTVAKFEPRLRTGDDFSFTHKGQTFEIPAIAQSPVYHRQILPDISAGQAISAFEMMRLSDRAQKKNGDPDGSRMYTDFLEILAIVAMKPGEVLPAKSSDRALFIEQRVALFEDIPADIALDADFFLSSMFRLLGETRYAVGFLSQSLLDLAVEITSWK